MFQLMDKKIIAILRSKFLLNWLYVGLSHTSYISIFGKIHQTEKG